VSKEWFMAAHEDLIAEYLDEHPDASEGEAYDATADAAYDRMCDNMAAAGDAARQAWKDAQ